MEQPANEPAGCSKSKRPRLPADQRNILVREHIGAPCESSLETINDDCLREIFQNLDIMDYVNLARTSERLHQFTTEVMFPKAANTIGITVFFFEEIMLTTPSYSTNFVDVRQQSVETAFRYFGEFVENISLTNVCSQKILPTCHNLKKLKFISRKCNSCDARMLQKQIESLKHLIELNLDVDGITEHWRASNSISNVTTLTLKTADDIARYFIDSFKNLSSLSLDLTNKTWQWINFESFLKNNSHCLKSLKLKNISTSIVADDFIRLLNDSLPKLNYLQLDFVLTDRTMWLINLPHLKSVNIECRSDTSVTSILQALSDDGIVEELTIKGAGALFIESMDQPPLNFPKLRTMHIRCTGILTILAKLQMPEIKSAEFVGVNTLNLDELCEFIESKNTLKAIIFNVTGGLIPMSFWCQIIGILKASSTSRRPVLSFHVRPFPTEKEVLELLKANRYLLRVVRNGSCKQ